MKVLINNCYGGFGYSDAFIEHIKALTKDQLINERELWERDNQFLVEEAIKFGLDKASGDHSSLTVNEIPDGAYYSIGEYDGQEWIENIWIEVEIDELRNGLSDEHLAMVFKGCDIRLKSH